MKELECSEDFSHYKSMGIFPDAQGQILTSIKGCSSIANLPEFKLIQALMYVLVTCKNEEDLIKNEGARVFTIFLPL